MTDLPSIHGPEVAATQLHVMVDPEGSYFYPDSEEDVALFAEHHDARPLHPADARATGGQHVLCGLDPCEDCSRRHHHDMPGTKDRCRGGGHEPGVRTNTDGTT